MDHSCPDPARDLEPVYSIAKPFVRVIDPDRNLRRYLLLDIKDSKCSLNLIICVVGRINALFKQVQW
jgi:hypothetical protein